MDAIFNSFFNLLNQLILVGMTLLTVDGRYGWFNLPFTALFLGMNGWAIFVWRCDGFNRACKFYSKANMRCFFALALMGLLMVGGRMVAETLSRVSR